MEFEYKKGLLEDFELYKSKLNLDFKDQLTEGIAFLHFTMGWASANKRILLNAQKFNMKHEVKNMNEEIAARFKLLEARVTKLETPAETTLAEDKAEE